MGKVRVGGTEVLREDHRHVRRLDSVIVKCCSALESGGGVTLEDMRRITWVISEFIDAVHYSREEDSHFACVSAYGSLNEQVRKLLIEHEFGRRIASRLSGYVREWGSGRGPLEPVIRYLRTYHIYLEDHLSKEDRFFDEAEGILSAEEDAELRRQFLSVAASARTVSEMVAELEYLEGRPWCRA